MSVYYDICAAALSQLQAITFSGVGGTASIDSNSIVLRTLPIRADREAKWQDEATPGIIISPAYSIVRQGGNTTFDWWQYPLLIQIIDRCEDRWHADKVASWFAWEEQIGKYFHHGALQNAVFSSPGYAFETWTEKTDLFDESRYVYHQHMKMALAVVVQSTNPRDSNSV